MSIKYQGAAGLVDSFPIQARTIPFRERDKDGNLVPWELGGDPSTPTIVSRVRRQIYSMISAKRQADMYRPLSVALNLLGLEVSLPHEEKVVVFVPCSTGSLRVQEGLAPKVDLVALLASRDASLEVIKGDRVSTTTPGAHEALAIVEISTSNDLMDYCLHYTVITAQNRASPASQFGLAVTKQWFRLLEVGLDFWRPYQRVDWQSESCIEELYCCVKLIKNEAMRLHNARSMTPRLNCTLRTRRTLLPTYCVTANRKRYDLFPVSIGRDPSRRPFVALASRGEHLKDARILKYSWRQEDKPHIEYQILKKIQDVPGVIQVDDKLCSSRADYDPCSGFVREILATKVPGSPLCSCKSVKEFLEAIYDLLEGVFSVCL